MITYNPIVHTYGVVELKIERRPEGTFKGRVVVRAIRDATHSGLAHPQGWRQAVLDASAFCMAVLYIGAGMKVKNQSKSDQNEVRQCCCFKIK